MRITAALVSLAVAFALSGCASQRAKTPPPTAAPAPAPAPPPTATTPAPGGTPSTGVPRAGGPIAAPWDTAAQSMESRRLHVYPEGESEISRRLLASIPEPGAAVTGASSAPGATPGTAPNAAPAPTTETNRPPPPDPASCWEVQIFTTSDHGRAEKVRQEAERELDVATWIRSSGGVYRVRMGGCLTPDGAAELTRRVRMSGYPDAYRIPRDP